MEFLQAQRQANGGGGKATGSGVGKTGKNGKGKGKNGGRGKGGSKSSGAPQMEQVLEALIPVVVSHVHEMKDRAVAVFDKRPKQEMVELRRMWAVRLLR